jgi:hypothetical protein
MQYFKAGQAGYVGIVHYSKRCSKLLSEHQFLSVNVLNIENNNYHANCV